MEVLKSDIVFGKDIVKNVAKEMGLPERTVQHVYSFIFPHIKKAVKEPEIFSVYLPFIGRMYMKTYHLSKVLEKREARNFVSQRQRKNHNFLKQKMRTFDEIFQGISQGKFVKSPHFTGRNINRWFYTMKKSLKELEEFQND